MAIYITMSDKVPLVFVNAYLPTTNESVSDYREHLDNLQIVYNTFCNDSIVIICGYLNVNAQLGSQDGPRGHDPQTIRGKYMMEFMNNNNMCSLITTERCRGSVCTFWPEDYSKSPSQIDHFIIQREQMYTLYL